MMMNRGWSTAPFYTPKSFPPLRFPLTCRQLQNSHCDTAPEYRMGLRNGKSTTTHLRQLDYVAFLNVYLNLSVQYRGELHNSAKNGLSVAGKWAESCIALKCVTSLGDWTNQVYYAGYCNTIPHYRAAHDVHNNVYVCCALLLIF